MKTLNFEKALEDLEKIVSQLEGGELSLSESLTLFEQGIKLVRFLRDELEQAEKKVEILLKNERGEVKSEPFNLEKETEGTKKKEIDNSGKDEDLPF